MYPLRDESDDTKTTIELDSSKRGPVIILNTEMSDPKSLLHQDSRGYLARMVEQLKGLETKLGSGDFDVVFLSDAKSARRVNALASKLDARQVTVVTAVDALNIEFSKGTAQSIRD